MAWTAADIPDQTGRIAVVTGANGGLGLETARALAAAGAHVVMAARNQEKAPRPSTTSAARSPSRRSRWSRSTSARRPRCATAAEQILAAHDRIDLLVNNAGVMGIPERKTVDGFEMQFGVDHLGHWSLTALLMPALLRRRRGADRHRHEHRAPHGPRGRSGQPAPRGQVRAVARVRPGEARQLPLRPRAAAAARGRRSRRRQA